jgi:hypothetical protein
MWVYLLSSARFQTFCLTPTNPMQPPFSRWYNPDKRCDVMVGSSAISIEQLQELQESSPEVGEQETSRVCEGGCYWSYCHGTSSKWQVIEIAWKNTDIARVANPRRVLNCQSFLLWNFSILHFVLRSHLILERSMSFLSSCCSEIKRCFF